MELTTDAGSALSSTAPVPVFDPASGETLVRPKPKRGQSRREFIRLALGVAAGIGLAFSDWLVSPFLKHASAQPCSGDGCFDVWTDGCHGFYTTSQTCFPADAYFGGDNCGSGFVRNFHRDDDLVYYSFSYKSYYLHHQDTCDGKNAWQWAQNRTMCSDGNKTSWQHNGVEWVVLFDEFSICRTNY